MPKPTTPLELAEAIARATRPFDLRGLATKLKLGRVPQGDILDLSAFSGVIAYEHDELMLEAGPATPLGEIETLLASRNQMLAFEPPDYSKLLGSDKGGSIGGILATNLSGPRRLKAGAARDHVLGLSAVSGRGEIFKCGARVVKNVTGYDVPKLMAGSYGTLAAFTSVILKVLPKAETETTLHVACHDDVEALRLMTLAMHSSCEVSSAAYDPDGGVYLRVEGIPASVQHRCQTLQSLLGGSIALIENSADHWQTIRDCRRFTDDQSRHVWKISTPPQDAPGFIATLNAHLDFRYFFDWAGGLVWLDHAPQLSGSIIRSALKSGHATLIRASTEFKNQEDVFHPQPPALAALSARLKNSFDPKGVLNPTRMVKPL